MNCLVIKGKTEVMERRKAYWKLKYLCQSLKLIVWSFVTGLIIGITPMVFQYAESRRLFGGIGGEIFFPVLPILCYPAYDTFCNWIWRKAVNKWQQKRILKIGSKNI